MLLTTLIFCAPVYLAQSHQTIIPPLTKGGLFHPLTGLFSLGSSLCLLKFHLPLKVKPKVIVPVPLGFCFINTVPGSSFSAANNATKHEQTQNGGDWAGLKQKVAAPKLLSSQKPHCLWQTGVTEGNALGDTRRLRLPRVPWLFSALSTPISGIYRLLPLGWEIYFLLLFIKKYMII